MKTTSQVRSEFLNYFGDNGHQIVESSPLVPRNDPTLLFTNAGMVQFKDVFTGREQRAYKRATTSQKCVRAGGKHNDLENVGYTARHHTFFEMLGNFSFGDYFKEQAITHAWELVTKGYGLPKERLLVTVYAEDDEAFSLWKKIAGLSDDRIIRIPTSDNFWQMGDTGPCGPCSEIFYDHGPEVAGGPPGSPDEDGDRFIEIWNLVFMQFEQSADGSRAPLPRPSIDTGMGLERMAAILQGQHDNYDIDLMRALIEASAEATSIDPDGPQKVSHRVIADHLRSSAFLIADGVLPLNEGRGYVLRRIMRRGMRHAHLLGATDPLMHKLVPALVREMGEAFPELVRAQPLIEETLRLEEARFKKTLDRGLHLLSEETEKLGEGQALSGEVAFKLYDTYGFPLDLTQDVLRGQGRSIDIEGFETAMARQRAEARKAWAGSGDSATETVWFDLKENVGATEFLGYSTERTEGEIVALVQDAVSKDRILEGTEAAIVTNQTPFYGESGGQVGDTGTLLTDDGAVFTVTDTLKKVGGLVVHLGRLESGTLAVGDTLEMVVDAQRRRAIRANHSATHLLHKALRQNLGEHISQKGSLVSDERLRFDISHPKAMSADEIAQIEQAVNERIRRNGEVITRLMPQEDAIAAGAMALFGEKYDDEVRVVSMGEPGDEDGCSVELCGGTHVARTGDIGLFKIVAESAVSAGVRRIEALTGAAAFNYLSHQATCLQDAADALRALPGDVPARVTSLLEERRKMERELADLRRKLASAGSGGGAEPQFKDVAGVNFAPRVLDDVPARELKGMADDLKQQMGSGVAVLIVSNDGKASIVVGVTADLASQFNAVDLVRVGAEVLGGKGGGGRPDMAQAGGPDASKAQEAIAAIQKVLEGQKAPETAAV